MAQVAKLQYCLVLLALNFKPQVPPIPPFLFLISITTCVLPIFLYYMPFSTPSKLDIESVISVAKYMAFITRSDIINISAHVAMFAYCEQLEYVFNKKY